MPLSTTDSKGSNTLTNEGGQLDESVYKVDEASAEFRRSYTDQMRLEESGMDSGFPGKSGESNKSFTVCFWVRVTMVGVHQDIFSKVRTDGNRQYIFSIDAGNYMRLNVSEHLKHILTCFRMFGTLSVMHRHIF